MADEFKYFIIRYDVLNWVFMSLKSVMQTYKNYILDKKLVYYITVYNTEYEVPW